MTNKQPLHTLFPITTSRLHIRLMEEKYIDDIFEQFTPEVAKYMSPKPADSRNETEHFVHSSIQKNADGMDAQCVITDLEGGFLGCLGFHHIQTKKPELGIWLASSAQGHGYGQEAIRAAVDRLRAHGDYEYIIYPIYEGNTRSQRVAESVGGVLADTSKKTVNRAGIEYQEWIYHIFQDPNN